MLSLIDKGIPAEDVRRVVSNLSEAGVAVEAMCFSDFPTETYRAPATFRVLAGEDPSRERASRPRGASSPARRGETRGRRPSHAHNSTKA